MISLKNGGWGPRGEHRENNLHYKYKYQGNLLLSKEQQYFSPTKLEDNCGTDSLSWSSEGSIPADKLLLET